MGGKTKQSQRTKNNVRPSSSGRSAELLGNINMDFSLLKLSAGSGQSTLFPTPISINLDQGLHPEFQICIKKLNKKDPITKTKALQELCELVNNNKVEDIVPVLPSWAHFYKILTIDMDRKVRENTQACHGVLMAACGRQVAPQLKQLLPAWLQALHDEHAPAQTFANASLKKTFPDRKLPEVLSFCRIEIILHLLDNLIGNAESVLIRNTTESGEEKEFHQYRVMASSLCALEYFTMNLPTVHDHWLWTELSPLLQSNVFWKFPNHKLDHIRAAWYATTGRLIERYKNTFGDKYGTRTVRVLLGPAREPNAVVAANLWACLLQLMHSVQDWYTYLDKKELLIKRILDILENGGWGDARHLSNLLLPLLAHLPPHVFHKEFYQSFFNAIYSGLKQKNIWSSKSERQSWIRSLAECLRYLSIQQHEFVVEVVTSVHRNWLQEVLCRHCDPQTRANLVKCSATNMASLVKYWLKLSTEQNVHKYEQLIRNFWQNIGSTTSAQIDKTQASPEDMSQLVQNHVLLFKTLKTSFLQDSKRQHSITFQSQPEVKEEEPLELKQKCDATICERYKHNLEELVHMMCFKYFECVQSGYVTEPVLKSLLDLLLEFNEEALFLHLVEHFHLHGLYDLYDNLLRVWLIDDKAKCKALVDIVFLLLQHMTEEEQRRAIDTFQQFPSDVCEWCVCAAVAYPQRGCSAVQTWIRSPPVHETLAGLCRRLVTTGAPSARELLLHSLAHHGGDIVVDTEAISTVLQIFCEALQHLDSDTLDQCGSVGAVLATMLPRAVPQLHHSYTRLLLQLFLLNYHVPREDPRLSQKTWCEVLDSWRDGIFSLSYEQRLELLSELTNIVHGLLFDNSGGLNVNKIERITCLCPYLLSKDSSPPEDLQLTSKVTRNLLDMDVNSLETFALQHDCIFANLNCPLEDYEHLRSILEDQHREMSKPDVVNYLNGLLFRCMYLQVILLHKGDEEVDVVWCDSLLADGQILMELCKVMYDYSIVCSLCEGYAFWRHYHLLQDCKENLEHLLTDIVTGCSPAAMVLVLKKLSEMAASIGYYWSYARMYFETLSKCDTDDNEPLDLTALAVALTGNGFFHSLQANMKNTCDEEAVHCAKFLVMLRSFYLAHCEQLEPVLVRELVASMANCDLTVIVNAYFRHNHFMLYETDIANAPWKQVISNAAILDFLTHLVEYKGWDSPAHCWDFTTITLCSVISSIEKSKQNWASIKVGMMARAVSRLYVSVSKFIGAVQEESTRRRPSQHVVHLPTEWKDIFAPDLHENLLVILLHLLEGDVSEMNSGRAATMEAVLRCMELLQWHAVPGLRRPEVLCRVRDASCACMRRGAYLGYQYLAHAALALTVDPLVLRDAENLSAWSDRPDEQEECERPTLCIEYLGAAYEHLQAEAARVEEGGDEANAAWCAWLVAADALHALCERARDDLQQQVMQMYRERGYADSLLSAVLRLLPARLVRHALEDTAPPSPHYQSYFLNAPQNSLYECDAAAVERLACRCLWQVVSVGGGAGARGWLAAAPPRSATLLGYLVRSYVSPHLVQKQLSHLQRHLDQLVDAEVKIRWSSNEVSCEFQIEERSIELRVWFARDHPLGLPRAIGPNPCGPALNTNWIIFYLAHQNGMLLNALKMWIQTISSRVESSPQCYICYCRLETTSGRLPRARCHQCNNKYHHSCLRKWFAASNKAICPLCRTTF